MIVGDDDFCAFHFVKQVTRHQFAVFVVAIRVVRLKHAQAVFDGKAGRDDEKAACESAARGAPHGVDGLPSDEHRHDRRFTGAGRQFQRQPQEFRVGIVVGTREVVEKLLADFADVRRDFREPDRGFDCLYLTEKRTHVVELVMPPMLKQPGRFGGHAPVGRIGQLPPAIHLFAQRIDDRRIRLVLLFRRRESQAFIENQRLLLR